MAINYETQLNKIKEAQKQSAIADLENTRNQTLSDLQAEQENNARNYASQRNQANVQNQLAAKNFKEFLVNTGRSNSGILPQYEMNRQNNLQRSINDLNSAENIALADIGRRNTLANQTYNTGLQSANANIEATYLSNLLAQQQAAWEREMQEKQFNEQVRQYNENLAWQKQQYQDQLARQAAASSSGGSSRSYGKSSGSSKSSSSNNQATLSTAGQQVAAFLSKIKDQTKLANTLNSAYKSGQITENDVRILANKWGL